MNRIYKVIWNEALNCFTAVGEYAKARGKSSKSSVSSNTAINTTSNLSTIKTLRLSAIGLGLLAAGFGMQTNATGTENHHDGDYTHSHGSHGVHAHTSGNNSHNNNSDQDNPEGSITLNFEGDNPTTITRSNGETLNILGGATGPLTDGNIGVFGIGNTLTIQLAENIDLGADGSLKNGDTLLDSSGVKITAINAANNVTLSNNGLNNGGNQITNVASGVGNNSNAANIGDLNNAVAANKTKYYSVNSTATGNANNDGATGPNAMAMGGNASATGGQAIAIGSGQSGQHTTASGQQSIAIGANVVSKGHSSIAIGGDDLDAASKANINGTSAFTINGGDVNATFVSYTGRDLVETPPYMVNTDSGGAASIAIGVKSLSEGALSTAIGVQSSSSGVASSAFGIGASASEKGSVALGAGAQSNTQEGVALGSQSVANVAGGAIGFAPTSASIADKAAITATNSTSLGAVSIGNAKDGTRQIVNVAAGINNSDAVNVSQLKALDTIVADIDFPIRSSSSQPYTTSVTGTNALAVGSNANANGSNSTVVGENAFGNSNSTVIGEGARSSFNGFAGGQDAKAGVNSIAIGQRATNGTSASRAVAIGYEAKATANDSVALGLDAQAQALGGVALGKGSRANALNSVALGQNSVATVQSGASFLTNVAADANNGTVSVGAVGSERRIVNVAGGSADTDAVNVSQLKAVTDIANEGWNISAQGNSATASNVGPGDSVDFNSKNNNITVSKSSTSNDVSFELNNNLDLGNNGSISTGNIFSGTQVNRLGMVTGGLAMGGVTTVSGAGVTVTGINPFNPSNATLTSDGLTILNGPSMTRSGGINAGNKKITNVKAGTTTTDAVNYGQLENVSNVSDSAMQTVITQINGNEVKTLDKTNNTANFLTGDNIVLSAEDGGIKVATAENVTFTSVTAGDTLLNTDGVSFLGSNTVRLSSMGLNNGGNRITEVADATELDDAVNLSQLNGVTDTANRGWDISAQGNSATASNVGPGEAVDFNSKNSNIIVSKTANSNDVSFELNNDLDLGNNGSVSTGNIFGGTQVNRLGMITGGLAMGGVTTVSGIGVTVTGTNPLSNATLTSDGLSMVGGPSITKSNGINAGNKKVTNVKAGVLDKDAVNVGQLNSSAAAAKTEVAAGTNVADVVKSTGQNGQDVYTVNADGVTASAGSSAVTVTAGDKDELTNMTDYAVDLSETSKASLVKADSAMQTVITQINGNEVKTLDKTDNTANFITGDNIVLSAEDGGIKVATAENVTFTSVTAGDTLLNTGGVSFLGGSTVRLSSMGLNNGGNRITEVADGEDDTDAVNIRQLNATNSTVDLGLDFTGDDTTVVVNRKLGQTLTIQGGATELTDNNIGVVADEEGNLNVKLAEDVMLGKNGSVRMESTVLNNAGVTITDGPNQTITLSNEGLDNGNNRIIKVGEGIAPTDAVNFAQLTTTNNEIAKGIKIGDGNSDNDQQFALGDTINVTGDSNLTTVASANGVQVKLNNQLDLGDEGSMQIGNSIMNNAGFTFIDSGLGRTVTLSSRGLDNGGNIIRNVGRGELNSDAVNVGQLREVTIALDRGWDITAQGDIATQVRQGDAIDLNSRDGNIKVSRTLVNDVATFDASTGLRAAAIPSNANDISFDLSPDITLNSVTTGNTTINDNGLTIAGGPSVTKSGIDAADTKITNIQNGEVAADSQDAVNGSQLYAQGSGISSIIGGNTVYNPENGTFINNDIGGTGQGNIDGAIASIRQGTIEINENVQVNTTNITSNTTDITTNTTDIATNTSNIATNTTNITTNTTNINTNTDRLDAGLNFGADSGDNINKPVGDESVLSFTGGNNITTTAEGSSIKFDLNGNISVDSVTAGTTVINSNGISMQGGPSMTAQGINAGSQRITGVADGIEATDAVNYSQLSALDSRLNSNMNDLGYRIDEVEDDANAGISAAMAMSALPQAYIAGKSLIGGGVSTYNGESAVAIGFSKLSNDGRWVIKVNGTADTQGNVGGAVGAGFHFD
ncbi:YadA-like family protein [Psychrobacter sp. N25K4-3-2]|uniref:ESPR-type extended signal peptide-containing protein n=1 Tax=Psychrobacter sp. N25K4-3-2 TaxID=2785026 RepID=UPI00188C711C|nr:YadA-like family protein [Psychrobacter sp. N25K4-3-2]MBF4489310.1 YadA-like family protein [Psychrobacter sp. N25K4-3-2]